MHTPWVSLETNFLRRVGARHRSLLRTDGISECSLNPPQTMHCDVQALQREKFFRFCKRLRYIPKMCYNPAAMSPLASHDHTPAAATGLLFFLAHIHSLARRI